MITAHLTAFKSRGARGCCCRPGGATWEIGRVLSFYVTFRLRSPQAREWRRVSIAGGTDVSKAQTLTRQ